MRPALGFAARLCSGSVLMAGSAAFTLEGTTDDIPPSLLVVQVGKLRFRGGVSCLSFGNLLSRLSFPGLSRKISDEFVLRIVIWVNSHCELGFFPHSFIFMLLLLFYFYFSYFNLGLGEGVLSESMI